MLEHDTSRPEPEIIEAERREPPRASDRASEAPELTSAELAAVAQHGGACDRLNDEPDVYTGEDGEPV